MQFEKSGWRLNGPSLLNKGPDSIVGVSPSLVWGLNFSIRWPVLARFVGFHPDIGPSSDLRSIGDGESGLALRISDAGYDFFPGLQVSDQVPASRLTWPYTLVNHCLNGTVNTFADLKRNPNSLWNGSVSRATAIISAQISSSSFRARGVVFLMRCAGRLNYLCWCKADSRVRGWVAREDYVRPVPPQA